MTWVAWRTQRAQLISVIALMAFTIGWLLITGDHTAAVYAAVQRTHCYVVTVQCTGLNNELGMVDKYKTISDGLLYVVPCLAGLLLGSPIVARELADTTSRVAWAQGVTKRRWLVAQLALPVAVLAVSGVGLLLAASRWLSETQTLDRVYPNAFDMSGLVLVAYALGAFAVSAALGAVVRRQAWTFAAAVPVVAGLRFVMRQVVRTHLAPLLSSASPLRGSTFVVAYPAIGGPPWVTDTGLARAGSTSLLNWTSPTVQRLSDCVSKAGNCPLAAGFRNLTLFHSGAQYWTMQWREAAIFVVIAAAVSALLVTAVRRGWVAS